MSTSSHQAGSQNHCIICENPVVGEELRCRRCLGCVHSRCRVVNVSTPEMSDHFVCCNCDEIATIASRSSTDSRKSARLSLALQQLEEQKKIRLAMIENNRKAEELRLAEEAKATQEKFAAMQQSLEDEGDEDADEADDVGHGISSMQISDNTLGWVNLITTTTTNKTPPIVGTQSAPISQSGPPAPPQQFWNPIPPVNEWALYESFMRSLSIPENQSTVLPSGEAGAQNATSVGSLALLPPSRYRATITSAGSLAAVPSSGSVGPILGTAIVPTTSIASSGNPISSSGGISLVTVPSSVAATPIISTTQVPTTSTTSSGNQMPCSGSVSLATVPSSGSVGPFATTANVSKAPVPPPGYGMPAVMTTAPSYPASQPSALTLGSSWRPLPTAVNSSVGQFPPAPSAFWPSFWSQGMPSYPTSMLGLAPQNSTVPELGPQQVSSSGSNLVPQSQSVVPLNPVLHLPLGQQSSQQVPQSVANVPVMTSWPQYPPVPSLVSAPPPGPGLSSANGGQQVPQPGNMPPQPPPQVGSKISSATLPVVMPDGSGSLNRNAGPTPAQIAARHVISKELPSFSGDPLEWPMFYSSFRNSTSTCGYSDAENLSRLQRSLKGAALNKVRCLLLLPESVPAVIATLHSFYGKPDVLINSMLSQVEEAPAPRMNDLNTLIEFGTLVQNLVHFMILANQQHHLSNPSLLQGLVKKLPSEWKMQWAGHKLMRANVNLATFSEFIGMLVSLANDVTIQTDSGSSNAAKQDRGRHEKQTKQKLFAHHEEQPESNNKSENKQVATCNYCTEAGHRIAECSAFKRLDIDGRWKAVRQKELCRTCLVPHRNSPCRSKRECGAENCRLRHHEMLHSPAIKSNDKTDATQASTSATLGTVGSIAHQHHHAIAPSTLLRYIPVTIHGNGKKLEVFALFDDGSTSTMLEEDVAEYLGVTGPVEPLVLSWTADVTRHEANSQRIQLQITGADATKKHVLQNVRTVEKLKLPSQSVNVDRLREAYPHLSGLPLQSYKEAVPKLIIGSDNVKLSTTLKIREGGDGNLVATKTRLGWCIYGKCSSTQNIVEHTSFHSSQCIDNAELHNLMKQFFALEEACITVEPMAEANIRAQKILEDTIKRTPSGYEIGLLWRTNKLNMPDSFPMAIRRMRSFERRLAREPDLKEKVKELIESYLEKGYAHIATEDELKLADPNRTWYLPLGVVRNPKKPQKIRPVWDAAAKAFGISFNDQLLPGPDLTAVLVGVLIRFRRYPVALGGDLREMFHQIKIRLVDRQSQRFLYRSNPDEQPQIYTMDVATFGATCSPSIAQFVKNYNADNFKEQYPRAVEAIRENHYVDDFLDSVATVEEAVELMQQVRYIHSEGGFELHHLLSNNAEVMRRLGETMSSENKSLNLDMDQPERVLGMIWVPSADVFTFSINGNQKLIGVVDSKDLPTKRQLLRAIMSVFDPLGLIANFVIHGKIMMQDVWRAGINWDELIPDQLHDRWATWCEYLKRLMKVRIPRCFLGDLTVDNKTTFELHAFVDASEQAYSCAVYLRVLSSPDVRCALIMAKTKVAPLKPLSIPRLELQGGLLGARTMDSVEKMLKWPISRRMFWTDSTTLLAWLRSDNRRYHQFVAFRVGEILTITNVSEWRYVPSKQNVADDATKWGVGPDLSSESRWFNAPSFLYKPETEWPVQSNEKETTAEELRPLFAHRVDTQQALVQVEHFSNYNRLLRSMAFVCRARSLFMRRTIDAAFRGANPVLTQEELVEGEKLLFKQVQAEVYSREYVKLKSINSCTLEKTSPLYELTPFMDEDGIIRMGSRIGAAPYAPYEAKYPIILPRDHRITFLLTDSYHRGLQHENSETVVNDMRQKFYIPKLRRVVEQVRRKCQYCKIRKAKPRTPRMGQLRRAQLEPFIRAFTYVGVDYFGPLQVQVGRRLEKRWVCLFTCLTVRAVHLEIVYSLSTNSCVMAFSRFVERRGAPLEVYTDNGTNFVGANRQLQEEIKQINSDCATTFTNSRTKWFFNPPSAPHMGGLWERMVRSVKTAMRAIETSNRKPSDEVLATIVIKAEGIVNSRPLTYVPLENADQEALTPNHFLLYGAQGVTQPASEFVSGSDSLRDSWKLAKYLVDEFWRRWVREYRPVLTKLVKWFEPAKPLKPGDLVIVVGEGARNEWIRGEIVDVYPDKKNQVRSARVYTSKGSYITRPAVKLAPLDVEESKDSESTK